MTAVRPGVRARDRLVQVTGPGISVFIALYFACQCILAMWTIGGVRQPVFVYIALGLYFLLCAAFARDRSDRLPLPLAIAAIAVGVAGSALISWQLVYTGYAQWYYGASVVTMILVALRGRIALAWLGFVLSSAVVILWGATSYIGVLTEVFMVAKHAPILLVGTLFAIGSRRARATIERIAVEDRRAVAATATHLAAAREREQRLDRLEHDAVPFLERIASGVEPTAADRREYALLSAEFRDDLRGRRVLGAEARGIHSLGARARRRGGRARRLGRSRP